MNVLITGYGGFLGNSIIGKFKRGEDFVVGFGENVLEQRLGQYIPDKILQGDIRDSAALREIISKYKIDEVYHFAGKSTVGACLNDPVSAFDINVIGTISLLEACRSSNHRVRSIVIPSSNRIFRSNHLPHNEETPLNPGGIYETSMAARHFAALGYSKDFDLPVKIIICSNIYGPGDFNKRIIPQTINRLMEGKTALLYKPAVNYIREFVYLDDALDAFILVSRRGAGGEVYCCGGTGHLTLMGLLGKICKLANKNPKDSIEIINPKEFNEEGPKQYMDSSKLRSLGWTPRVSLEDGLKRSMDFYKCTSMG